MLLIKYALFFCRIPGNGAVLRATEKGRGDESTRDTKKTFQFRESLVYLFIFIVSVVCLLFIKAPINNVF